MRTNPRNSKLYFEITFVKVSGQRETSKQDDNFFYKRWKIVIFV